MIKKIRLVLASFSLISVMAFAMMPVHAEDVFSGVCSDLQAQSSTVCKSKELGGKNPIFGPDGVLTVAINIISIIVGVVALIFVILGGLKFITSGSNPQDVSKARETVIYALVGLMIAGLAQVIVQFFLKKIN